MERGIFRAGAFGQHCGFSEQSWQSSLLEHTADWLFDCYTGSETDLK